ncbi:hypothetical protein E2I00_005425 [Balaenoptera physalus]|uniref:Uncharacterized protein n=1 Tax=Balaenoptera physalus TaxID=9770 RepID=A0A643CIH2_BALPH|nr:hypothetical protein E2I00_005425 [Balaenoptera physalus]
MTAVICTYPLDMVRVRLAFQVKGEHTYTGIIHAFKTIYAKRLDAYYIRNGSICSYPFDVTRRRMQLGTVLPEFEKCLTMRETMKYVYGHHGIRKGLYRGLSLNYIRCVPSQAVAFTTYELMKQFFHLN